MRTQVYFGASISNLFYIFRNLNMSVITIFGSYPAAGTRIHNRLWCKAEQVLVFPNFCTVIPVVFSEQTTIANYQGRCITSFAGIPQSFYVFINGYYRYIMFNTGMPVQYHRHIGEEG